MSYRMLESSTFTRTGVRVPSADPRFAARVERKLCVRAQKSDGYLEKDALCNLWSATLSAAAAAAVAWMPLDAQAVDGAAPPPTPQLKSEIFQPMRYIGRWYEIASIKKGFAGEGQQDCHCTQGVYLPKEEGDGTIRLQANTFCVHGSPTGRISGIQGQLLQLLPEFETPLEREEDIVEKCVLRFPSLPFIPAEPYDVVRSDYSSYAIVQGANDRSFVQIYSRTPNPGPEFMQERMATLKELGYDLDELRITPQDCPVVPMEKLMAAMPSGSMMDSMMTNTMPPDVKLAAVVGAAEAPDLKGGIQFSAFGNPLTTLKDLVKLGSGSSS